MRRPARSIDLITRLRGRRAACRPGKITEKRAGRDRAERLPDLRLVLGHVHGQLHELPVRGAGLALPGNGTDPGDRPASARSCSRAAGPADRRTGRAGHQAARYPHRRGVRERLRAGHGDGRLDQHRAAHAGDRASRPACRSTSQQLNEVAERVPHICKVSPARRASHGGCGPRRRHQRHPEGAIARSRAC